MASSELDLVAGSEQTIAPAEPHPPALLRDVWPALAWLAEQDPGTWQERAQTQVAEIGDRAHGDLALDVAEALALAAGAEIDGAELGELFLGLGVSAWSPGVLGRRSHN